MSCRLDAQGDLDDTALNPPAQTFNPVSLELVHTFSGSGTVDLQCAASAALVTAFHMKIIAIKVGSLSTSTG